jgi:pyruvate kinase
MTELWYTVGPASLGKEDELLGAGATGARLTFSYGTTELQRERARALRSAASRIGRPCLIIADLPGGKFRLGKFEGSPRARIGRGTVWRLAAGEVADPRASRTLPIPDGEFFSHLRVGNVIVVGDGTVHLKATGVGDGWADVVAITEGEAEHRRGLTVRESAFEPRCLTDEDLARLDQIAATSEFDAVALSFVSSAADVRHARHVLGEAGPALIAKIETRAALVNLENVCAAADGVLAARGDLALCVPWVELPAAVQAVANAAGRAGLPWYLATQVAEGSSLHGFPTRAEICDLANWRLQGCSGALLAHETAFGRSPVAAVAHTSELLRRWDKTPT